MLYRFLILFSITLFLSACYGNKKPQKPENLISREDMVDILLDIKLLASASGKNREILNGQGIQPEDFIYKKYHIDSLQFALSNAYYSYYTVQYESIYAKVNDSLTQLKELYKKQNEREIAEERIRDSMANIVSDTIVSPEGLLIKEDLKGDIGETEGLIAPVSESDFQPQ